MVILPRQARDKHRENSNKNAVFMQAPPVPEDDLVAKPVPAADAVQANARAMWADFWERGGAYRYKT
jgi:hypothetical protein